MDKADMNTRQFTEDQIKHYVLEEAANRRPVPTSCRIEPRNFMSMARRLGAWVEYDGCPDGAAPQLSLLLYVGGSIRVLVRSDPTIAAHEIAWANDAEKAPTAVYDVAMVRGLARAASLLESINGGRVWDDESRTALELARRVGAAPNPSPMIERQVYEPASNCSHETFTAGVSVHRMSDSGRFVADVRVYCSSCGDPFHFQGVPAGLSFERPTVGVGATTLHAPIAPGEAPLPERMTFEVPGH